MEIGSFWTGRPLGRLERLCIRTMQAHGYAVTVFHPGDLDAAPDGVRLADSREIVGAREVIRHRRSGSPALFANLFRYHMLARTDLIWLDLDVILLDRLTPENGYLVGYETPTSINNAVLRLPRSSPTLADLIAFCEDPAPIPPFLARGRRARLRIRRALGLPVKVEDLPWGVWGPRALTWFLTRNGEDERAAAPEAFYPIPYGQLSLLLAPEAEAAGRFSTETRAVHLYHERLRRMLDGEDVPAGSFLGEIARRHGMAAEFAA